MSPESRPAFPDRPVRSFVALPCPPDIVEAIAGARREWRSLDADVRWTDPGRIHVTLRFLGDAPPSKLATLHRALARTAAGTGPVALRPGRTGAFPGWERPRVLWLGLEDDGALSSLAARVEEDVREAGFEPEERPFRAHLTLGRVKGGSGVGRAVAAVRGWTPDAEGGAVEELVLYRSDLGPAGPSYTALARYPLEEGE